MADLVLANFEGFSPELLNNRPADFNGFYHFIQKEDVPVAETHLKAFDLERQGTYISALRAGENGLTVGYVAMRNPQAQEPPERRRMNVMPIYVNAWIDPAYRVDHAGGKLAKEVIAIAGFSANEMAIKSPQKRYDIAHHIQLLFPAISEQHSSMGHKHLCEHYGLRLVKGAWGELLWSTTLSYAETVAALKKVIEENNTGVSSAELEAILSRVIKPSMIGKDPGSKMS